MNQYNQVPDPGHHMGVSVTKTQENITHKRAKKSALNGDHKAARNKQDSITNLRQ